MNILMSGMTRVPLILIILTVTMIIIFKRKRSLKVLRCCMVRGKEERMELRQKKKIGRI